MKDKVSEPRRFNVPVGGCYFAAIQERGCNTFGVVCITRTYKCFFRIEPVYGVAYLLPSMNHDGPMVGSPPYADAACPTLEEAKSLAGRLGSASVSAYRDTMNSRQMSARGVFDAADCAAMDEPRDYVAVCD